MPHGMLPTGVVYMPFLPSWREQFPGLEPVGLTATVIHLVPGLRDVIQWLGGREVRLLHALTRCGTLPASVTSVTEVYARFGSVGNLGLCADVNLLLACRSHEGASSMP